MKKMIAISAVVLSAHTAGMSSAHAGDNVDQAWVTQNIASMPLAFTENRGQWDEEVLFSARAPHASLWFTSTGVVYQFTRQATITDNPAGRAVSPPHRLDEPRLGLEAMSNQTDAPEQMIIRTRFLGSKSGQAVVGREQLDYKCSYYFGSDPAAWQAGVSNCEKIVYEGIYSGVDLTYYGNGRELEYDFAVEPGADIEQIRIEYSGVKSLTVDGEGQLVVETDWGSVVERAPVVYQTVDGQRITIEGRYVLINPTTFGFQLSDAYNPGLAVIIDPVLSYGTYLGGAMFDQGYGIAISEDGMIWVTGTTTSADFPVISGMSCGLHDAFLTVLDPTLSVLVYSIYFGGSNDDFARDIAVDPASGDVWITGWTYSDASSFPITSSAYQSGFGGGCDVFIAKFSHNFLGMNYSSYLGGYSVDQGYGITIDGNGNPWITGYTQDDFPVTGNAFASWAPGGGDAFIASLDIWQPAPNQLTYGSYLGGSSTDAGTAIAVDGDGRPSVTGCTSGNFPLSANCYDNTHNSGYDVFVTQLDPSQTSNQLRYSSYLGSSGEDYGYDIAVDAGGLLYVTGLAGNDLLSPFISFPTTPNAYDFTQNGIWDAFVAVVDPSRPATLSLPYSTFLGGSRVEVGYSLAVSAPHCVHVTGVTFSQDFPLYRPVDIENIPTGDDSTDIFVAKLKLDEPTASQLVYSTFLGGSLDETSRGIAVDANGDDYVTGTTQSANFPATAGSFASTQPQPAGSDAFVAKLSCKNVVNMVDGLGNSMSNHTLYMARIDGPGPDYPETSLGTVITNVGGDVQLPDTWVGDCIKVSDTLYKEPRNKHTPIGIAKDKYVVEVDNGKFIDQSGSMYYDTLFPIDGASCNCGQTWKLDHTTIALDLVVYVEWDADQSYLDALEDNLRTACNYIYDVFDGQARIRNVYIEDKRPYVQKGVPRADMYVWVTNCMVPQAYIMGSTTKSAIHVPLMWVGGSAPGENPYGDPMATVNASVLPGAPVAALAGDIDFKTKAFLIAVHSFGFGVERYGKQNPIYSQFYDPTASQAWRNDHDPVYGFMENPVLWPGHWLDDGRSSELSRGGQTGDEYYQPPVPTGCNSQGTCTLGTWCQKTYPHCTHQYVMRNRSCWSWFEWYFEDLYGSPTPPGPKTVEIYQPHERGFCTQLDGPNDAGVVTIDMSQSPKMNVDIVNHGNIAWPGYPTIGVTIDDMGRVPYAAVVSRSGNRWYNYGLSSNQGEVNLLFKPDKFFMFDHVQVIWKTKGTPAGSEFGWRCGEGNVDDSPDTIRFVGRKVVGNYPFIHLALLDENGLVYQLAAENHPQEPPVVSYASEDGGLNDYPMTRLGDVYSVDIPGPIDPVGFLKVRALDDEDEPNFVLNQYICHDFTDDDAEFEVAGPNLTCALSLDSLDFVGGSLLIMSSPYPPIRTGLETTAVQAGQTISLSRDGSWELSGENTLTIMYDERLMSDSSSYVQQALQMWYFDPINLEWAMIGGECDTAENTVTATITNMGTYAAFAPGGSCCVGRVGDANGSGDDMPTIGDVSVMIDAKFITGDCILDGVGANIRCLAEADANLSGGANPTCDDITIGDISMLIDDLFITGEPPFVRNNCAQ